MEFADQGLSAFHAFDRDTSLECLPDLFTYPFCYEAHPLAGMAVSQLQEYLNERYDNEHNFGIDPEHEGLVIGKMFGVLVVRNGAGELGFLAAYSGKLAQGRQHPYFVPPVYDVFEENGMFMTETRHVSALNLRLETLEQEKTYLDLCAGLADTRRQAENEISALRGKLREWKKDRQRQRKEAEHVLEQQDFEALKEKLRHESLQQQYELKVLNNSWSTTLGAMELELAPYLHEIEHIKEARRESSASLQRKLFENYRFLNARGEWKSLLTIFTEELNIVPPAGAGECAAPKLLQYAYCHGLEPVAMAEFWWGASPKSEVRKHGEFYPACRSKCIPILSFMLQGLNVEANPLENNPAEGKELKILHEDEDVIVVNKPAEFLSVPGRYVNDSVQSRIRALHPEAFLVHRLDQSTSGIILVAKGHENYVDLQKQFLRRTVEKRYLAVLDGTLPNKEGFIDLPLRVDLDNRPRQVVCYEYGKAARTRYKVIKTENDKTLVYFFPITGRTHQLRVHAAHQAGLNTPIAGDDLYGNKADRLYLHAQYLEFDHPRSRVRVSFTAEADFSERMSLL